MKTKLKYLIIAFMLMSNFCAYATENKSKLSNANKSIKNINKALNENKQQQKNVNQKMYQISNEINKKQQAMEGLEGSIQATQAQVDTTSEQLRILQADIKQKENILGKRIRIMYKISDVGFLDVLFSSKDITEFLSNMDMIKKIVKHDKDLLNKLSNNKKQVQIKEKELKNQRMYLAQLKDCEYAKKNQLIQNKNEQNQIQLKLKSDQMKLEKDLDELNRYANTITSQIKQIQSKGNYSGGVMAWPASSGRSITSSFGNRYHPIFKKKKQHTGVDIPAPGGSDVVAANAGKVIKTGWMNGYGNAVIIDHGGGISTLYAHNSRLVVSAGQTVKRGQVIAKVGSTGNSTGNHLHFEVRQNNNLVDPVAWIK